MPALGQRFRAAREARGLSLPEVAEQIRIRAIYLAAIEDENWNAIGAPVYVRGFLRTYARFLGLDAEEVVAAFNVGEEGGGAIVPSQGWVVGAERGGARRGLQLSPLIWLASLVAVLLVAFVVYNELTLQKPAPGGPPPVAVGTPAFGSPSPADGTPSSAAPTSPTASVTPMPSGSPLVFSTTHALTLRLSGLCWLRVVVDGGVSIEGTFPAGTTKTFYGKSAVVRVGNAGAVDLVVDGRDLGKMGATGSVVERSIVI
ncbi:MAG TPA: RodZ domain-containing protein [Candidatus Tyrphobacter sp.]